MRSQFLTQVQKGRVQWAEEMQRRARVREVEYLWPSEQVAQFLSHDGLPEEIFLVLHMKDKKVRIEL